MKKTIFFGAIQKNIAGVLTSKQAFGPNRPVFPDLDIKGVFRNNTLSIVGKSFCLSPLTDWDFLSIYIDGDPEPVYLRPGMLYNHNKTFASLRCELPMPAPATRLTNARGEDFPLGPPPNWRLVNRVIIDGAIDDYITAEVGSIYYTWDGAKWNQQVVPNVANYYLTTAEYAGTVSVRPADASPDGVWSFADYLASGAMHLVNPYGGLGDVTVDLGAYTGNLFVSKYANDSNGNPGDATNPTVIPYISSFNVPVSPYWCGVAAIEVFDSCPCDYRPILPATRQVKIIGVAPPQSPAPGTPDFSVVTVPSYNIDRAQFTFKCDPAAPAALWASLGTPLPGDLLSAVADVDSTPAMAAIGGTSAVAILENVGSLIQIQLGSNNAGLASKLAYGQLVLTRKHCG